MSKKNNEYINRSNKIKLTYTQTNKQLFCNVITNFCMYQEARETRYLYGGAGELSVDSHDGP